MVPQPQMKTPEMVNAILASWYESLSGPNTKKYALTLTIYCKGAQTISLFICSDAKYSIEYVESPTVLIANSCANFA